MEGLNEGMSREFGKENTDRSLRDGVGHVDTAGDGLQVGRQSGDLLYVVDDDGSVLSHRADDAKEDDAEDGEQVSEELHGDEVRVEKIEC